MALTDAVRIRRATDADADAIADVHLRSRRGAGAAIPPGVHPDDDVHRFVRDTVLPEREAWVAESAGRVIGVLVLHGDDLDWLWVDLPDQGKGVGGALLEHAERLRPDGLALWVFASNTPAREFYERRGWRAVRTTEGDNEEGAPDVRYVVGAHPEGMTRSASME